LVLPRADPGELTQRAGIQSEGLMTWERNAYVTEAFIRHSPLPGTKAELPTGSTEIAL